MVWPVSNTKQNINVYVGPERKQSNATSLSGVEVYSSNTPSLVQRPQKVTMLRVSLLQGQLMVNY